MIWFKIQNAGALQLLAVSRYIISAYLKAHSSEFQPSRNGSLFSLKNANFRTNNLTVFRLAAIGIFSLCLLLSLSCNDANTTTTGVFSHPPGEEVRAISKEIMKTEDSSKIRLLFENASKLAKNDSDRIVIAQTYDRLGVRHRNKSDYALSLIYLEKGLEDARRLKSPMLLASLLNNIGVVYRRMDENNLALDYHMEALKIAEAIPDVRTICISLNSIGNIHMGMNNYEAGLQSFRETLRMERENDNKLGVAINLNNIGGAFEGMKSFDSARLYYNASLEQNREIKSEIGEGICFKDLASLYINMGNYDSARYYLEQAIALNIKIGDRIYIAESYNKMAEVYQRENNLAAAFDYYQKGLDIAKEIGSKWPQQIALEGMSEIYSARGEYSQALATYRNAVNLRDTLTNEKNLQHILNVEHEYETLKNEKQIESLTKEKAASNFQKAVLAVGILLLIIIFYSYYRNLSQKNRIMNQLMQLQQQQINKLETEKKLTATEAVLKGEEKERTRLAKDLHDGLGGMLSGIKYSLNNLKHHIPMQTDQEAAFERSMQMLDGSIREMRRVAHNMMPEALVKFGLDTALRDFCNDINQSGAMKITYQSIGLKETEMDQTKAIAIYRIVQELINNALKHAEASEALVQLTIADELLSITVEDDGKGFDTSSLQVMRGIGWSNIQHRVDFLKGRLDVHSHPEKGTSVFIELHV